MKSYQINLLILFSIVSGGMNLLLILGRISPAPSLPEQQMQAHRAAVSQLSECLRINMELRARKK